MVHKGFAARAHAVVNPCACIIEIINYMVPDFQRERITCECIVQIEEGKKTLHVVKCPGNKLLPVVICVRAAGLN